MRRRGEAADPGDLGHRHVGLEQQLPGPIEAELAVPAAGMAIEMLAEEALEMAARDADAAGDGIEA